MSAANSKADTAGAGTVPAAEPAAAANGTAPSRVIPLILLALLGVLAFAGYLTYVRLVEPRFAALEARIDALPDPGPAVPAAVQEALDSYAAELTAVQSARSDTVTQLEALAEQQGRLAAGLDALAGQSTRTDLDWVLAEAEYLVLAANQRLALERDVATALAALQAADNRLRAAAHPELIALREQLARDIAALEGVGQPDIEGLALYLAAAVGRVDDLPTKPIADIGLSFAHTEAETVAPDNWRGVLAALWHDLVSLVEVKDAALPDGVLFDPKLRYFLQQNLKLELSSARLALLARDSANFSASLALVDGQLAQYYDEADAGVAALKQWLDEHRQTELDPAVPAIAGSLDALRAARAGATVSGGADASGTP